MKRGARGERLAITYERALSNIYSLDKFGSKLGLQRILAILHELGEPQESYRCVLVGGSNGKGSTVEFIGAALQENGWKTGTYFSPQIEEFPERIRINGKNASRGEIARAYQEVARAARKVAPCATFFEIVTAIALIIFKRRKVKVAVLEVGLGGRLDATNAVEPEVSAITGISLEHTEVLGRTLGKIAREKCGIARKGKILVCGKMPAAARKAVERECARIGAHMKFAKAGKLSLSAPGEFQRSNAAVAAEVARALGAGEKAIARGMAKCKPRFRLERRGNIVLDCAHNPEAAEALAREIAKVKAKKKVLLFSAMKDKDYEAVLALLAPQFDEIVVTEVAVARGEGLAMLAASARKAGKGVVAVKDPKKALKIASEIAGGGKAGRDVKNAGIVAVAGSIYLLASLFGKDKKLVAQ